MAHFAQLDQNNVVIWVTPIDNSVITDENGVEQESLGIQYIHDTIPDSENYTWKQTSINNNFRVRYAGIGYYYDENLDAFIPPKFFDNWIFDSNKLEWIPPIPRPEYELVDDTIIRYEWEQRTLEWTTRQDKSPYPSWIAVRYDDGSMSWQPPISYPNDGKFYSWNEESQSWDLDQI